MTTQFPTPYPDETWYSLIVRYHKHSGNQYWTKTKLELFDQKSIKVLNGISFPCEMMRKVKAKYPDSFDLLDIALNHTLFSYTMRFQPLEKKTKDLNDYLNGMELNLRFLHHIKNEKEWSLRYCPICRQEDIEKYGEPYWHAVHQIQLMPLCPIHRCRLINAPNKKPYYRYYFPVPEDGEPVFECTHYEPALTDTLNTYLRLPYDVGPNTDTDNLARGMENAGLLRDDILDKRVVDEAKLYEALVNFYPPELVQAYFGDEIADHQARHIKKFKIHSPEKYALISTMLGLAPEAIFSEKPIPLRTEELFRELTESGYVYTDKQVARIVGVPESRLKTFIERAGIEQFWLDSEELSRHKENLVHKIVIRLTQEEDDILSEFMKENAIELRSFALYSILHKAVRDYQSSNYPEGP